MMQVVENRTDIRGVIEHVERQGNASDLLALRIRVDEADSVPGYHNLLEDAAGQTLTVLMRGSEDEVSPGQSVCAQVRLAQPSRLFLIPGTISPFVRRPEL